MGITTKENLAVNSNRIRQYGCVETETIERENRGSRAGGDGQITDCVLFSL